MKIMDSYLEVFTSTLDEEIKWYKRLKGLLEKKRSLILIGDIEELRKVISEEKSYISTLQKLDLKRQDYFDVLVDSYGVEAKNVGELLFYLQIAERKQLEERVTRLLKLLNTVAMINIGINDLLQLNLGYIGLLLDLVIKPTRSIKAYDSIGKKEDGDKTLPIIDLKG